MLRLTPVVKNLLIINVAVFLLEMFSSIPIVNYLSLWNVRSANFQPYQLFTYMFVHSPNSFTHIFFNMLGLVFFGPILETYWGTKRFLLFYIIAGIGAAVFNVLVDLFFGAGSFGLMLGASGAIYGVLTAFGMIFPNMEIMLLIPPIPIKAKYLVLILGGMAIYSGISNNPGDNVAHFTHLGGIVVAFILVQFWRSRGF